MRALLFATLLSGCNLSTGSALVTFVAQAGGPADITSSESFTTGSGYDVVLSEATLHLAAAYLNATVPLSGAQQSSCVLPQADVYVGEMFGPLDLDLLSSDLQTFPAPGQGTETLAQTAEVWLAGGSIDATDDTTPILQVAGTAICPQTVTTGPCTSHLGGSWPFTATVTIGQNRALAVQNPALPGSNPICHQRIVTPIPVELTPTNGGTLTLRVDPRGMFDATDFSSLVADPSNPGVFAIPDAQGGVGGQLFDGLHSSAGVYDFAFQATNP